MAEETDLTAGSVTGSRRRSPWGAGRRLSERTPLRTKLITAVLALVMLALVAISFTSVYVLRSYLTTQNDGPVTSAYQSLIQELEGGATFNSVDTLGQLPGHYANVYAGLQQYGSQLSPPAPSGGIIGGGGNPLQMSVPSVPSTKAWATANAGKLITLPAHSGANTWRVIAESVTLQRERHVRHEPPCRRLRPGQHQRGDPAAHQG